jgi:calcium-dependent protein kinase
VCTLKDLTLYTRTWAISKTSTKFLLVLVEVSIKVRQFKLGAYGEVRKCLHKETKALRAVKIINKKFLEAEEQAKLLSEISILKELDHPNILKLYEFFQDHKRYFLVTE